MLTVMALRLNADYDHGLRKQDVTRRRDPCPNNYQLQIVAYRGQSTCIIAIFFADCYWRLTC